MIQNSRRASRQGRRFRTEILVGFLLAIASLSVFAPALGHGFVIYDDNVYVYENPHVREGLTAAGLRWALTTTSISYWHPLTWLSHMLDCQLFGLDPWGHHLTSVLLHAANSVLLFLLLRRMTGLVGPSGLVAGLFAVHPLRIESVAWVAERKDVLGGFFWIAALLAYVRHAEERGSWRRYALLVAVFALGLMSKPMLVAAPAAMLVLDFWPLGRLDARWKASAGPPSSSVNPFPRVLRLFLEKVPLVLLAAGAGLITLAGQRHLGIVRSTRLLPIGIRIENALLSTVRYIEHLFWPVRLAVFYPYRTDLSAWRVAGAAIVLLAITVLAAVARKTRPYLLAGWIWYLVTLLPVLGLVQSGGQAMADRYTYIPTIGLLAMIVWGAADLVRTVPALRLPGGVLAAGVLILLSLRSLDQLRSWRDSVTLFEHAIVVTADNGLARYNLGCALAKEGRTDEAIAQFTEALRIDPRDAASHNNLGNALIKRGRTDDAIAHFREAIRLRPSLVEAHINLGAALRGRGETDAAIDELRAAVALAPGSADTRCDLGFALASAIRFSEAFEEFSQAIRLQENLAPAHHGLGLALDALGRIDGAIASYSRALQLDPLSAEIHRDLAVVLARRGRLEEAREHLAIATALRPDDLDLEKSLRMLERELSERRLKGVSHERESPSMPSRH